MDVTFRAPILGDHLVHALSPRPRIGFLNFSTADILGWVVLCCGASEDLAHGRMYSSIPGLYLPQASSTSPPALTSDNQE